ncbi:acetyl-CoA carboxylase biotin carboxylase subunit family protein, partial [Couchioplanes caeruleus]
MSAPIGWLGLIAGEWTIAGDASSCARRTVRAGRALGLRTLAVSTDERCLARLAADGWSLRPASGLDPASIATAFAPAGSRAIAPALLVGDGPGLSDTTARVAALLGARNPDPGAVARSAGFVAGRRTAVTPEPGRAVSRYVAQAQDGQVIGIAEDVTADGRGRDYDCPGSAQGWHARRLRAHARAALDAAGLT